MMEITPEMTVTEILRKNKNAESIFREFGMHCFGCSIASGETLKEAAKAHSVNLKKLLEALRK